jgi:hypothetical protein
VLPRRTRCPQRCSIDVLVHIMTCGSGFEFESIDEWGVVEARRDWFGWTPMDEWNYQSGTML